MITFENRNETSFIIDWLETLSKSSCAIQYEECFTNVLENIVNQTFKEYFDYFMNLFLGGFSVFNDIETPLPKLQLWFNKCQDFGINLNLEKCIFWVYLRVILVYIFSKEGKLLDLK